MRQEKLVIVVTHDMELLARVCTRCCCMDSGAFTEEYKMSDEEALKHVIAFVEDEKEKTPDGQISHQSGKTKECRLHPCSKLLFWIATLVVTSMTDSTTLWMLCIALIFVMMLDGWYVQGTTGANKSNFDSWFDSKTKTFGGQNAISTVTNIVGNASRFNLAGLPDVPKVDLPDLQSFFVRSIKLNGRQISWQNGLYSFKTPEEWAKNNYGIKTTYQDLFFNRKVPEGENPKNLCGVGNKVFNLCLKYADGLSFSASTVKGTKSYFIYKIFVCITKFNYVAHIIDFIN